MFFPYGSVAQLVEQWIEAPCVGSSILSRATIFGGVAKWLNAADCKSAPLGSAVRICPPPPFFMFFNLIQGYSLKVEQWSPKPLVWVQFLLPLPFFIVMAIVVKWLTQRIVVPPRVGSIPISRL